MSSTALDGNLHYLDQTLSEINFTRDWSELGSVSYTGDLLAHGVKYPVTIKIEDFNFVTLPKIYFKEHPGDSSVLTPHILANCEFCYATNNTTTWSNHDDSIGKVIGCIQHAQNVLEDIVTGKLTDDITAEFASYWGGEPMLLDIADYKTHNLMTYTLHSEDEKRNYNCVSDDLTRTRELLAPTKLIVQPVQIPACIIQLEHPLCPDTNHWPPKTVGDLSDWLQLADKNIWKQFRQQVISLKMIKASELLIIFMHNETQFAVRIQIDKMYWGKFRPNEKFRKFLLESEKGRRSPIKRFTPYRIDNEFILTRGRGDQAALAGKKIVLVGCGTIGGYLAHLLVRGGAGSQAGELILVDPDIVMPANIARHILGIEFLFRPKVEALSEHLLRDMPLTEIKSIQSVIQDIDLLKQTDLVIDATGDESLSMYLNERRIKGEAPDVIHTWIEGAGLAAQAFLAQSGSACLRCLNELNNKRKFSPVRDDVDPFVPGTGCDDYFIPYPGSLSAQTAGLAATLVIDWANNNANLRLRTLRFDYKATIDQRPRNPDKLNKCPTCNLASG